MPDSADTVFVALGLLAGRTGSVGFVYTWLESALQEGNLFFQLQGLL
jgi:hypothetical protein